MTRKPGGQVNVQRHRLWYCQTYAYQYQQHEDWLRVVLIRIFV
jgi:hypothetical protein